MKEWVAFPGAVDEIDSNGVTKIALWRASATTHSGGLDGTPCFAYVTGDGRNVWVSQGRYVAVIDATTAPNCGGLPTEPHLLRPPLQRRRTGRDPQPGPVDRHSGSDL